MSGIGGGNSGGNGLTDAQLRADPVPVEATIDTTGLATSAKQDTLLTELQLKADLTETQPVSLAAVPSHAVTNAGTFAVQVSSAPTTAVTGTFWQTTQPISGAVTTTGTVTEASGAAIAASLSVMDDWDETDRAKVNIIAGQVGVAGGTGTDSALTQRVSLATNVALPAGTNVLGHVIADTGSTTAVTGNVTVVQATGTNLHAVLDTTSTTAVTQATGTNLHAVIDTGSTTAVTQATGTNLHAVIDSGSITAVQPTGTNLHVVTDTNSTTAVTGNVAVTNAGLTNIDVALSTRTKPADQQHAIIDSGTTTVTQATGTNLHTVVDSGSITAVQPTGTNLHVVVDTTSTTAVTQATATNLNAAVVGTGTAGTAAGGVLTVQGVASMTPLLATVTGTVSATSAANVVANNADVAYTAGDSAKALIQTPEGFLRVGLGGLVGDSEELYVPGRIQMLSLTAEGRLRIASVAESFNFTPWGDQDTWGSPVEYDEPYPCTAW